MTATTTDTAGRTGAVAPARGLHGHKLPITNMLRAATAEAIGTFFLVYTGTATAGAAALG